MKIAVTGYRGRLGSRLVKLGCVPLECDVTSRQSIVSAINAVSLDVVINCASFTRVDDCENPVVYEKSAIPINTLGLANLDLMLNQSHIIHISTDYIFNGKKGPYKDNYVGFDPINNYGFSKFGAEAYLRSGANNPYTIIRTTGLYGVEKESSHWDFVCSVVDALKKRKKFYAANNLFANQTYIPHLADALMIVANDPSKYPQTINLASSDIISRYEFALRIADKFGYSKKLIIPVESSEIPGWIAPRPVYGGLKVDLAIEHKLPIYDINTGLYSSMLGE